MSRFMGVLLAVVLGEDPAAAWGQGSGFSDAVTKVEARLEPTSVRRGETVTWKLTIRLTRGWHTYPSRQTDERAAAYINKFRFPSDAPVAFVGPLNEPKSKEHSEDGVRVKTIEGEAVWTRAGVVRLDAKPGKVRVPVRVTILTCADRCLPPKTHITEAELIISDQPAVPIDPRYRDEVK